MLFVEDSTLYSGDEIASLIPQAFDRPVTPKGRMDRIERWHNERSITNAFTVEDAERIIQLKANDFK
ncbi:MAG: hypothetical protein AAFU67_17835, partial [Bacteroidota bacterium]